MPALVRTSRLLRKKVFGVLVEAQLLIGVAYRHHDAALKDWLLAEILFDASRTGLQDFACRHRAPSRLAGVRELEEPEEEIRHLTGGLRLVVGSRRFLRGAISFTRDASSLFSHRHRKGHDQHEHRGRGRHPESVPARKLRGAVPSARRSGHDGFVAQVPPNVSGHSDRRLVPSGPVLLERLHRDPVQVPAKLAHEVANFCVAFLGGFGRVPPGAGNPGAGFWRIDFPDDPADLVEASLPQRLPIEGQRPREQFVEQHPERINVGSRVDVESGQIGLLRAHVLRRADEHADLGEERPVGQVLRRRLCDSESITLGTACPSATVTRMFDGLRSRWMTPF
jgi:hypothetical protein